MEKQRIGDGSDNNGVDEDTELDEVAPAKHGGQKRYFRKVFGDCETEENKQKKDGQEPWSWTSRRDQKSKDGYKSDCDGGDDNISQVGKCPSP